MYSSGPDSPMSPSEAQVAEALTAEGVAFEYEHTEFKLEPSPKNERRGINNGLHELEHWRGFRPDFFLPELNIDIEVTTSTGRGHNGAKKKIKMHKANRMYGIHTELILACHFDDLRARIREIVEIAKSLMPSPQPPSKFAIPRPTRTAPIRFIELSDRFKLADL